MTRVVDLKILVDDKAPEDFYDWLKNVLESNVYIRFYIMLRNINVGWLFPDYPKPMKFKVDNDEEM